MKIKHLIKQLQKLDPELDLVIPDRSASFHYTNFTGSLEVINVGYSLDHDVMYSVLTEQELHGNDQIQEVCLLLGDY